MDAVVTKRYTRARVKRLLTYILVNVPKSQIFEKPKPHVLGFSAAGQRYLKNVDVVTKVGKNLSRQTHASGRRYLSSGQSSHS